jgi:hypothetical protein
MMSRGRVSAVPAFLLAFAGGLAAVWWLLGLVVSSSFRGPDTDLPLWSLALPLVGVAVFQLAFTGLTGMWRGPMFWVWAVGLTYGLGCLAVWVAAMGWLSWPLVLAAFVGILGGIGLFQAGAAQAARRAEVGK